MASDAHALNVATMASCHGTVYIFFKPVVAASKDHGLARSRQHALDGLAGLFDDRHVLLLAELG